MFVCLNDAAMKTINLLPKPKQQELRSEAVFHGMMVMVWISVFSFAAVFLVQFGTRLYLYYQSKTFASDIEQLTADVNKQDNTKVKAEVGAVNTVISDFKNLSDAAPKWSGLIKAFVPLVPPGVRVNTLQV